MSIRFVKFVPALFAGVVAGGNLATTTDLRAQVLTTSAEAAIQAPQVAADSCLSTPKGATPPGSHWYYRLDRVTKRQCWYLREEGDATDDKFARAAPPASAPASTSTPASTSATDEPETQQQTAGRKSISDKSISDARAEWQPRAEVNRPARVERTAAAAAPAPIVSDSPRAAMPNVLAPAPLSSMRWNDATPTRASLNPPGIQLAAATPPAAQLPRADDVQQPAADQVVFAAAADAAPAKPTASLQKLLIVMAAALALAGLTVSAIVRIGRMRARRAMRRKRRAMWDSAKTANKAAKTRRRAPQPQQQPNRNRCSATRTPGCGAPQPCSNTRTLPQEKSPTRPPRERPARPRSGHTHRRNGGTRRRIAWPRSVCRKTACRRIAFRMTGTGNGK